MKHLLHHEAPHPRGWADVYSEVTAKDFDFSAENRAFLKAAIKDSGTTVLMVSDLHGTTLIACPKTASDTTEASVIAAVLRTLRQIAPVEVVSGEAPWERY